MMQKAGDPDFQARGVEVGMVRRAPAKWLDFLLHPSWSVAKRVGRGITDDGYAETVEMPVVRANAKQQR